MCFCKLGVSNKLKFRGLELSYIWFGGSDFILDIDDEICFSNFNKFQNFKFSIKVFVFYKGSFILILGYKLLLDYYDFDCIGNEFFEVFEVMDVQVLKSNVLDVIMIKLLDENRYIVVCIGYVVNGNYWEWIKFDWLNFDV